jgi:hypothetical protein
MMGANWVNRKELGAKTDLRLGIVPPKLPPTKRKLCTLRALAPCSKSGIVEQGFVGGWSMVVAACGRTGRCASPIREAALKEQAGNVDVLELYDTKTESS